MWDGPFPILFEGPFTNQEAERNQQITRGSSSLPLKVSSKPRNYLRRYRTGGESRNRCHMMSLFPKDMWVTNQEGGYVGSFPPYTWPPVARERDGTVTRITTVSLIPFPLWSSSNIKWISIFRMPCLRSSLSLFHLRSDNKWDGEKDTTNRPPDKTVDSRLIHSYSH